VTVSAGAGTTPCAFGGGLTVAKLWVRRINIERDRRAGVFAGGIGHCSGNTWLAPSVLTGIDAGQVATPEPASEQVKLTTTLLLFQPAALDRA